MCRFPYDFPHRQRAGDKHITKDDMETANSIRKIANIFYVVALILAILVGMGTIIGISAAFDGEGLFILLGILGGAVAGGLGIFFAWVMKTLIYGYAELVENTAVIRANTTPKA